jgi:hypothetical protein
MSERQATPAHRGLTRQQSGSTRPLVIPEDGSSPGSDHAPLRAASVLELEPWLMSFQTSNFDGIVSTLGGFCQEINFNL